MRYGKTARVIATLDCGRECAYCVNYQKGILDQARPLSNLLELRRYREVLVTGGEPTLWPDRLRRLVTSVRQVDPQIKIHLYASDYTGIDAISRIARLVDGLTWTMHPNPSQLDIGKFQALQDIVRYGGLHLERSFRLELTDDTPNSLVLTPWVWSRIQLWRPLGDCVLPEGETLYLLDKHVWESE